MPTQSPAKFHSRVTQKIYSNNFKKSYSGYLYGNISEVVQQTSQGADESATAAAQLSGNAEELQWLLRRLKL
jgi:hypothetical protein